MLKAIPTAGDDIEELEARIEELREAIQRSRRLMAAGRAGAVLGMALLVGSMLALFNFAPAWIVLGIALTIGGIVLAGSSRASTDALELSLKGAEGERRAAIDQLDLVHVKDKADASKPSQSIASSGEGAAWSGGGRS